MKVAVELPPGWVRTPFPAPQRGLYIHAPPGGVRGAMLLMDAIAPHGTLAEQLDAAVATGCADTEPIAKAPAIPFRTIAGWEGLSIPARVRVTHEGHQRDELRVFSLVDAGEARLPVVLIGDPNAAEAYKDALGLVLYTIRPDGMPLEKPDASDK